MRFLAVHPNFELYGSDRSFANAVAALERSIAGIDVTVALPQKGPILTLPVFTRVKLLIEDMWIPRRGDMSARGLPGFLARGIAKGIRALAAMKRYDLVYIDTIISFDYIVASMFSCRTSIIHVREIPTGAERKVFRQMLLRSRAALIFNSKATRDAFDLPPAKAARSYVVYNGTAVPPIREKQVLDGTRPIRVLVIGRINAWKGQEVLVRALAALSEEQRTRLEVRIVGGVFGDMNHFHDQLVEEIAAAKLESVIAMRPFQDDPSDEYHWADLVVVPSTKPEPFGRVAIEAMSHRAAVVGSAHGGLTEIVVDHETGRLFPPSHPQALADILASYIKDPALLLQHGRAGYERFTALFTDEASDEAIVRAVKTIVSTA